jgi:hypothetical protein
MPGTRQNDMPSKDPPRTRNGALEAYLRARIGPALRALLAKEDYELSSSPEADLRLHRTAAYFRCSPSMVVSSILGSCSSLLDIAKSDNFREWAAGAHGMTTSERLNQAKNEELAMACDMLDDILARKYNKGRNAPIRCHLVINRNAKCLVGEVAVHLSVNINDIVESLIMLGLEDHETVEYPSNAKRRR